MVAGISAISLSVMPRAKKFVMQVTNVKGFGLARPRTQWPFPLRNDGGPGISARTLVAQVITVQGTTTYGRRQLRRVLSAKYEATPRKASTLADLAMKASS